MTSAHQLTERQPDKQRVLNRLRRLEGQVRGLQKMVEEERPCQDILTLLSGIRSALDATGDAIFEEYINRCLMDDGTPLSPQELVKTARLLR
ncbi:metal-sensitive transcriptional regulator [Deinococcus alpinitundrae]|uniref:metal-sensitive transcriptional regulator n=1 Tax=Deinococcus alpinitundrae TaxID=468913 RepID=UPI00137B1D34|nr:metal-sensitive transcriptional regulator [Deinococcus alpinitundrae]